MQAVAAGRVEAVCVCMTMQALAAAVWLPVWHAGWQRQPSCRLGTQSAGEAGCAPAQLAAAPWVAPLAFAAHKHTHTRPATLTQLPPPGLQDHVVACTGGMVPMGALTTVTAAGFSQAMHDRVLGQILLAQALVPLLRDEAGSSYTVITGRLGGLAERVGWAAAPG